MRSRFETKTSHLQTFLRGSAASAIAVGIIGVLNYLIRRYLALNLSEYDYGMFYSILALVSMAGGFAEFGLTQSGTLMIAEAAIGKTPHRTVGTAFSTVLVLKCTGSLLFFLILMLCNVPFRNHVLDGAPFGPYLLISLLLLTQIPESTFAALWNGTKCFGTQMILSISRVTTLFVLVILLTPHFSIAGTAAAFIAAPFLLGAVDFLTARFGFGIRMRPSSDPAVWRRLLKLSGYVAVSTTLFNMLYHLNTLMLTMMKGVEVSAQYNIALPIMQIMQAALVLPTVFLPIAIHMVKERKYTALRRVAMIATALAVLGVPVTYLFFHFFSATIIRLMFAEKFVAVAPTVTILCSGLVLYLLSNFLMQIIISLDGAKQMALATVSSVLLNILLNLLLIPSMNYAGAAWGTAFAYLLLCIFTLLLLFRLLRRHELKTRQMEGLDNSL